MRILNIRFMNLNSLVGEWKVDLTDASFTSNGIFAITGPTGSGKTTLLDAICLGLYGQTPRLGKINQSSNEIMSRKTGECFAEVMFETMTGRYTCHWYQHRSHKKSDGKLQDYKHEISNTDNGEILECAKRDVLSKVESITGMDFDRFTRSMLLAQGGFSAFLHAKPDDRAPILEQITGTEIYSLISIKVHEMKTLEFQKLNSIITELEGIKILDSESELELRETLGKCKREEQELAHKHHEYNKVIQWLETVELLKKNVLKLKEEWHDFMDQKEVFHPQRAILERGRHAQLFEGKYATLLSLRQMQEKELVELNDLCDQIPVQEKTLVLHENAVLTAERKQKSRIREVEEQREIIKKTIALDERIMGKEAATEKASIELESLTLSHSEIQEELKSNQQLLDNAIAKLEVTTLYREAHETDVHLTSKLESITRVSRTIHELETEIESAEREARQIRDQIQQNEEDLQHIHDAFNHQKTNLNHITTERTLLKERITCSLDGRELIDWQAEQEQVRERKADLMEALSLHQLVTTLTKEHTDQEKTILELGMQIESGITDLNSLDRLHLEKTRHIESLEISIIRMNRIRDLAEERLRLVDGEPCVLCGSKDHPFAMGSIPEIDEMAIRLVEEKKEQSFIADDMKKMSIKVETHKTETSLAEERQRQTSERLAEVQIECQNTLKVLGLDCYDESILQPEYQESEKKHEVLCRKIKALNELFETERNIQERFEQQQALFTEKEILLQKTEHRDELSLKTLSTVKDKIESCSLKHQGAVREFYEMVSLFDVGQHDGQLCSEIVGGLVLRSQKWNQNDKRRDEIEQSIGPMREGLVKSQAMDETKSYAVADRETELTAYNIDLKNEKSERCELFGEKSPAVEEEHLSHQLEAAERLSRESRDKLVQVNSDLQKLNDRKDSLTQSTDNRNKELREWERDLNRAFEREGLENEKGFLIARLKPRELDRLSSEADGLQKEETRLQALLDDKSSELNQKMEQRLTEEDMESLVEQKAATKAVLSQLQEKIGGIKQILKVNKEQQHLFREKKKREEDQKREYGKWESLHTLIGSADGKKFRNFAQGLTFEMMISHANQRLQKMTDRYLLIRDEQHPLVLNVVDSYRAGDIRSTKNLSGGESFIVSLSLALGLSSMSSRNVRVDSLFLDEGFGSLDEEALDTALETLAGLHQDGKLIGIISHVSALKERIHTQIQVIPETGGKSMIKGPGVTKIR